MVREVKNSRAKTIFFSREFSRKHVPQVDRFWLEKIIFIFRANRPISHPLSKDNYKEKKFDL
nr:MULTISPECIES: DUF1661 domain-containing protein [Porphyromonas]